MGVLKKIFFACFFLLALLFATAQKQANTWYFGNGVGLDFNQSPPKPLYNSHSNTVEGCTAISDHNGHLLFYSNGITVFHKTIAIYH